MLDLCYKVPLFSVRLCNTQKSNLLNQIFNYGRVDEDVDFVLPVYFGGAIRQNFTSLLASLGEPAQAEAKWLPEKTTAGFCGTHLLSFLKDDIKISTVLQKSKKTKY